MVWLTELVEPQMSRPDGIVSIDGPVRIRLGRVTSTVGLTRQDEAVSDGAQRGRGQDERLHVAEGVHLVLSIFSCE